MDGPCLRVHGGGKKGSSSMLSRSITFALWNKILDVQAKGHSPSAGKIQYVVRTRGRAGKRRHWERGGALGGLFLAIFNGLPIFAGYNLDLLGGHDFIRLHLERRVVDYECPNVVAKSIDFQTTLRGNSVAAPQDKETRIVDEPSRMSWSSPA